MSRRSASRLVVAAAVCCAQLGGARAEPSSATAADSSAAEAGAPAAGTGAGSRGDVAARADGEPVLRPGPLATSAAVFPGLIVTGAGHFAGGDRDTARKLLVLRGIGLGVAVAGGIPLGLTRAARRTSGVPIGLMVAGAGIALQSWLADIYGSAGGGALGGQPRMRPPTAELAVGYGFLRDQVFAHDHLTFVRGALRRGAWRAGAEAWVAADADNQRAAADLTYRMRGPGAQPSGDGSYLELVGGLAYHRYGDDQFWVGTADARLRGRLDLARIGESLGGSYAELGLGVGYERTEFEVGGVGGDWSDMLLARFAFGVYLGQSGEAYGYYDHRRDQFVAGLSPGRKNGSGFLGHFGVGGVYFLGGGLGISADYAAGGSHLFQVGVRYAFGGGR